MSTSRSASPSIVGLIVAGRYLLNPLFRMLADSRAREVMTAAALLVVLGSALAMQLGGLSMAMGAFLAGVLLSESTFRHQLEADVEPFRGILLGLFFMAVGMSLDLSVVAANWQMVAIYVVAYMVDEGVRHLRRRPLSVANHREALERAVVMAQGGEFAFVLYSAATAVGIIDGEANAILTAIIIISMVADAASPSSSCAPLTPKDEQTLEGVEIADGLTGSVLIIGFGRFGQIVSQPLLLRGVDVSIIDNDVEMIQAAADFGFKVYYGDGTRLDILHAAGAGRARAVLICVDKAETAVRIAENMKAEFPLVPVLARAYDRGAAIGLIECRRRLPDTRDLRIRPAVRRSNAGEARRRRGRGCGGHRGCPPPRCRAAGAADIRRPPGRPTPHEGEHPRAHADAAHSAQASRPGDERRRGRRAGRPGCRRR